MPDDRRLLLTGATGFLGRHVLKEALSAGFQVHATARSASKSAQMSESEVVWHHLDLRDGAATARLVRELAPTHIINAAWDTRHGTYWTSDDNSIWVATALDMIDAFANCGGRRFVQIGSCAEYDWGSGVLHEDVTPENPATPYGRAKLAVHHALQEASAKRGFSAATARIFFAFGPFEREARIIPSLCRALSSGERCSIANPDQVRDPLFVSDAARAVVTIAQSATVSGAVNVGSGEPVALGDVGLYLEDLSKTTGLLSFGGSDMGRDDAIIADISKLTSTGWTRTVPLWQGMHQTYSWWAAR